MNENKTSTCYCREEYTIARSIITFRSISAEWDHVNSGRESFAPYKQSKAAKGSGLISKPKYNEVLSLILFRWTAYIQDLIRSQEKNIMRCVYLGLQCKTIDMKI